MEGQGGRWGGVGEEGAGAARQRGEGRAGERGGRRAAAARGPASSAAAWPRGGGCGRACRELLPPARGPSPACCRPACAASAASSCRLHRVPAGRPIQRCQLRAACCHHPWQQASTPGSIGGGSTCTLAATARARAASRPRLGAARRTCAVRAAAGHARDARHGAARAPRLGRRLVAGLGLDGVRLAVVLGHVGVHALHDIRADGRHKHGGQRHLRRGGEGQHGGGVRVPAASPQAGRCWAWPDGCSSRAGEVPQAAWRAHGRHWAALAPSLAAGAAAMLHGTCTLRWRRGARLKAFTLHRPPVHFCWRAPPVSKRAPLLPQATDVATWPLSSLKCRCGVLHGRSCGLAHAARPSRPRLAHPSPPARCGHPQE